MVRHNSPLSVWKLKKKLSYDLLSENEKKVESFDVTLAAYKSEI